MTAVSMFPKRPYDYRGFRISASENKWRAVKNGEVFYVGDTSGEVEKRIDHELSK